MRLNGANDNRRRRAREVKSERGGGFRVPDFGGRDGGNARDDGDDERETDGTKGLEGPEKLAGRGGSVAQPAATDGQSQKMKPHTARP